MANTAFSTKKSNFNDYLAKLEELLRKNKGSGLYQGYDVNPNAQILPGKIVNASGLGNQQYSNAVQFDKYSPDSISFSAPNVGSSAGQAPQETGSVMGDRTSQPLSAQDFFNQVGQATYAPEQNYFPSGVNYSGTSSTEIYPMASMPDGNVLWSDGYVRAPMPSYLGKGASALSQGLFGRSQTITQPYGQYNPIEPTPGNINRGTDFRVRDLQDKTIRNLFAQPLRVVEVYANAQPGSGSVGNRENRGYGNSVLLALQDGSMIRVSHFDSLAPLKVGDTIQPGQEIGIAGATGNVTGQHADVEVYNKDGQIVSPDQFMAQIRQTSTENKPLYQHQPGQMGQESQPQQPDQVKQGFDLALQDAKNYAQKFRANPVQEAKNIAGSTAQTIAQPALSAVEALGTATKAPELGVGEGIFTPEAQKARLEGISGTYNPYRHLAGNIVEAVGDAIPGTKEGTFSEAIAGGPTAHTTKALASEIGANTARSFGQAPTIQEDLVNIGKDISQKAQPIIDTTKGLVQKAKDAFGKITAPGIETPPSPMQQSPDSIQVGQVSGDQSVSASFPGKTGDTRDPFFKYGGSSQFADFLKPNAEQLQGGALSTSLFTPEFYKNPTAVGSVFGKTSQAGEATNLYKDYLKSNIKPGYDQPYKEDIVTENGVTYKVLTPIPEYFQNQYWQNQLNQTPDKLTSDFSYNDYEVPKVANQQNKGEVQTVPSENPFFKSGAASLFRTAGDKTAQFVQGIGNKISDVYKANPFSKTVSLPEQLKQSIQEKPAVNYSIPEPTRQVISVNGSNDSNQPNASYGGQSVSVGSNAKYTSSPISNNASYAGKAVTAGQMPNASQGGQAVYKAPPSQSQSSNPFAKILSMIKGWF